MATTLLDLLCNSLVLRQTTPYLDVCSLLALSATSKSFHYLINNSPDSFRRLDLTTVKAASIDSSSIDKGGVRWRSQRMDEALTEDEFYSGPLLGIFNKLARKNVLACVSTLVLDGLTVTADMVNEIITKDSYNVRILSIREAKHLNERKLRQSLMYAVRPSRPAGTPRLKGLYVFGAKEQTPADSNPIRQRSPGRVPTPEGGVMYVQGAQIGAEWNHKSQESLNNTLANTEDKWYQSSGRMVRKTPGPEWAETLQACAGIIAFDAVLCRGPRHNVPVANARGEVDAGDYLPPTIATVALGQAGCMKCGSCPEGPAVFGHSPSSHLPLLAPPPLHSSTVQAAQKPHTFDGSAPLFMARCDDCLRGRWCERCNKFWDESCYAANARPHPPQDTAGQTNSPEHVHQEEAKVHMGLCIASCLVGEMMSGAGSNGMWG
ncbi:hypothetical protein K402DRAFT_393275 [Aulographum hederae CBS 113979]|uniref:F-box domain-containing protein n=1 Tax=Aulographum hederae CBS 113979 TaxID=1176131 RepID=A0A6G1H270_9PEZI|nr:hypothetical protein K402DRAFT_393275 [Aulographum hederae CBS 113979]